LEGLDQLKNPTTSSAADERGFSSGEISGEENFCLNNELSEYLLPAEYTHYRHVIMNFTHIETDGRIKLENVKLIRGNFAIYESTPYLFY
jgi:hypothetical protein